MKENEMVFGIRAVIEAIQADKEIDKILVKRELQGDLSRELFEVLKGRDIPVQRVPAERLDRLTRKNHQGVIAFIPAITYERLENIIPFVYEQGKNLYRIRPFPFQSNTEILFSLLGSESPIKTL